MDIDVESLFAVKDATPTQAPTTAPGPGLPPVTASGDAEVDDLLAEIDDTPDHNDATPDPSAGDGEIDIDALLAGDDVPQGDDNDTGDHAADDDGDHVADDNYDSAAAPKTHADTAPTIDVLDATLVLLEDLDGLFGEQVDAGQQARIRIADHISRVRSYIDLVRGSGETGT